MIEGRALALNLLGLAAVTWAFIVVLGLLQSRFGLDFLEAVAIRRRNAR